MVDRDSNYFILIYSFYFLYFIFEVIPYIHYLHTCIDTDNVVLLTILTEIKRLDDSHKRFCLIH